LTHLHAIIQLLSQKRRLVLDFEATTQEMLSCPIEQIEALLSERGRLIMEADGTDDAIELLLDQSDRSGALKDALSGRANRGALDTDLGAVYDAAAAVRAIISRILEAELQLTYRLESEQARLLDSIKDTNRGLSARAARFSPAPTRRSGQIAKA
jgi:hypothetical protein